MPTYAQLRAETWWNREIVTPEIKWLGTELCRATGRPAAAFGSKGDNNHLRGSHRSQEWLLKSRYSTSKVYTVQSGLTAVQARHVAGIDFTPGSSAQMIAQCKRIYSALRAGRLEAVREFYGNINGDRIVDGFDNVRNRPASADDSHLWHWHLSLDRRQCADRALMQRILETVLGRDNEMELTDTITHVKQPDVTYSKPTTTVAGILASTNYYVLQTRNKLMAEAAGMRAQLVGLAATVDALAEVIRSGGGSVDVAAIKAHIDARAAVIEAEMRDAVADLGEGGAEQVRAG